MIDTLKHLPYDQRITWKSEIELDGRMNGVLTDDPSRLVV